MNIKMINDKPMNIRQKQPVKLHVYKKIEIKDGSGKTGAVSNVKGAMQKRDIARSPTIQKLSVSGHGVMDAFNRQKVAKSGEHISFGGNNDNSGGDIYTDKQGSANNNVRQRTSPIETKYTDTKSRTSSKSIDIQLSLHQLKEKKKINAAVRCGGNTILNQLDGGEEINQSLMIMENVARPAKQSLLSVKSATVTRKRRQTSNSDSIRQRIKAKTLKDRAEGMKKAAAMTDKQARNYYMQDRKQTKKAASNRIRSYVLDKMSAGETRDTLANTVKDIVKLKAALLVKGAGKYLLAAFAPLLPGILMVAAPVVMLIILLYCSPLAIFLPPIDGGESPRQVLTGYYQEFRQQIESEKSSQNAEPVYTNMNNGIPNPNFNDTLMVYMVRYGTGQIGTVMNDRNKERLKEVFTEMNYFETTSDTYTVKAGESIGQVVTSAYCSCPICCGPWSGGPTASGVMPTDNHTIAVDANSPTLPMGTEVIMNGIRYKVEDTGQFDRFGVDFDIYFSSHSDASAWGHRTVEAFLAEGNSNEVEITGKVIKVHNLNYQDYIALGKLTKAEETLLTNVMEMDWSEFYSGEIGSMIAQDAMTKVGMQYSQERRYEEGYYDCSSLVQRLYREQGVGLPAIAAPQGQYCVDNGLQISETELRAGDLIFYSYEKNGQYMDISHVAIYVGEGMMVHAASTDRGVVYDPLLPSNISLYGRPSP